MNLMRLDKSNYQLVSAHARGTIEHLRQIQKMVLYPDYPINTFQTVKPNDHMWKSEMFNWLWTNPEVFDYIDSWQYHMKSHHTMIDPKYKVMQNGKVIRYSIFRSGPYFIGKIPDECMARAFPSLCSKR